MNYPLASSTWDEEEISTLRRVISSGNHTMGKEVEKFEHKFANYFGSKYSVMVNSGSSANLLMVQALKYSGKLKSHQNEIIVPAVSWSTTYFPINQTGYKIIFVDIESDTFNINVKEVEKYINKNTAAILAVNLLGAPCDLIELQRISKENNVILLEDNCESMGSSIKNKMSGTFGLMGTFSTFYSHHISTMEGGVITTDDEIIYEILLSLRAHGWVRQLKNDNSLFEKSGNPWEDSFTFVLPGFNVRPIEMEGALGITQLNKFDNFLTHRKANAEFMIKELKNNLFPIQLQVSNFESSWFGFGFTIIQNSDISRKELINHLSSSGIESRPIVAGNFTRNPVIKYLDYEICGELSNADYIHDRGFFIGNHHFQIENEIKFFANTISLFLRNNS